MFSFLLLSKVLTEYVYFVHPSTNISVDISTDTRPMFWSTYQPSVNRYVVRHIDRCINQDIGQVMVDIWANYRQISRSIQRLKLGRYTDHRLSAEYRSTVGGILVKSLDCQCQMYKLYPFHPVFGQPQKLSKASCSVFMCRKFSCPRLQFQATLSYHCPVKLSTKYQPCIIVCYSFYFSLIRSFTDPT